MVDWSKGNGFPYEKAAVNTQVVGADVALFIRYLIEQHGAKAADFHVIGHSLGAQTAGCVGARVEGLGRITGNDLSSRRSSTSRFSIRIGLDPAGPYFENTDPKVRLDPTDAQFVDVMHTDGSHNLLLGLGWSSLPCLRSTFPVSFSQEVSNEWVTSTSSPTVVTINRNVRKPQAN